MTDKLPTVIDEMKDRLEIKKADGRTQIVFKKALLHGKVSSSDVLNAVLIAARMQTEKFIEKLSRGAPLDKDEVKSLKEIADITKLVVEEPAGGKTTSALEVELDAAKKTLYAALTERLVTNGIKNPS